MENIYADFLTFWGMMHHFFFTLLKIHKARIISHRQQRISFCIVLCFSFFSFFDTVYIYMLDAVS
jgi:hypothetical protein